MKNLFIAMLLSLGMATDLSAQTFDMTKAQPAYTDALGYGYDVVKLPTKNSANKGFFFSAKVPDGNYKVTVTIGSKKKAGNTVVRAENRRLLLEATPTKKRELKTFSFIVNKRSTRINDKMKVLIKPREKEYLNWDNRLTLEFNGPQPVVTTIKIEPADASVRTIFLCGNSTVVDQNKEPWASWGQMIPRWFDDKVSISNHAESGLTAGTFLAGNRLDKILSMMKKGDYVVCEFGHNDQKERRAGDGAWYNYAHNLKIFIDRVRKAGGEIIFVTPTQRRSFDEAHKHINETHGEYPDAMRFVAKKNNVAVIELHDMTRTFFETLGYEDSKRALVHYPAHTFPGQEKAFADNTHFNTYGAYEVAKMVVMGMKQIGLPVTEHLRADWKDYNPAQPDDWKTFKWYDAPLYENVKPDGN